MPRAKPIPPPVKHAGHKTMLVRVSDKPPHTAKLLCLECSLREEREVFIKWVSTKR